MKKRTTVYSSAKAVAQGVINDALGGRVMIDAGRIKTYIDGNLSATLGVKTLSVIFGKHPADLDRAFRNRMGITIKKYIDLRLKEHVGRLILSNHLKGYEIGQQLGFLSDQSFYRWVKRVFGIPYGRLSDHTMHKGKAVSSADYSIREDQRAWKIKKRHQEFSPKNRHNNPHLKTAPRNSTN